MSKLLRLLEVKNNIVNSTDFTSYGELASYVREKSGKIQRLKLFEIEDEGSIISEYRTYAELKKFASSKGEEHTSPAVAVTENETVQPKKKKLIANKLQEKVAERTKEIEEETVQQAVDTDDKEENNDNDNQKKNFWERFK